MSVLPDIHSKKSGGYSPSCHTAYLTGGKYWTEKAWQIVAHTRARYGGPSTWRRIHCRDDGGSQNKPRGQDMVREVTRGERPGHPARAAARARQEDRGWEETRYAVMDPDGDRRVKSGCIHKG